MIKTAKARGIAFRHSGFGIDLSFVIRISSFETTRDPFRTTCEPCNASLYENLASKTGRYRSGQTGQTVNLLALRLRWFESSPAQIPLPTAELMASLPRPAPPRGSLLRFCPAATPAAAAARFCDRFSR